MEEVFRIEDILLFLEADLKGNEKLSEGRDDEVKPAHVGEEVVLTKPHCTLQLFLHHHAFIHQVTRHLPWR